MRDINQAGLDLIKKFEGIPGDPTSVNIDPYLGRGPHFWCERETACSGKGTYRSGAYSHCRDQ